MQNIVIMMMIILTLCLRMRVTRMDTAMVLVARWRGGQRRPSQRLRLRPDLDLEDMEATGAMVWGGSMEGGWGMASDTTGNLKL